MPKKFIGENRKAVSAKERQLAAKLAKEAQIEREIENYKWEEQDKKVLRKQQRKDEVEKRRQDLVDKKAANKALLQQEISNLSKKQDVIKITRAEIEKVKETSMKKVDKITASEELIPNENRSKGDVLDARNVVDAIAVLNVKEDAADKHPEKRRKSAYKMFEERRLNELKSSMPQLKFSQIKNIILKEWQKSPENPINRFGSP